MITPDLRGEMETPLYEQLYEFIKEEIISKRLGQGDKLPSKRSLAEHLNISINTVTSAYEQLVDEGYISSLERKGYFVENLDRNFIVKIDNIPVEPTKEFKEYVFDFSFSKVDHESFPFSVWRKIAREVIIEEDTNLLNEMDPQGLRELRVEIASYLRSARGVVASPSQIVVSAGTEYLFQMIFALLDSEDTFAMENPGYERLSMMFQSSQRHFLPISLDKSGISVSELENSNASVACVAPSHQFPTGVIMPLPRRMELLNWARKIKGRYIIEDDYDSEFRYSGKPIPALKSLDVEDVVIYIGSFSKSIFPGLRISYMILPEELLEEFQNKLTYFQCPVSTVSQKVLGRFIEQGNFEKHLNRMRKKYKKKRELMVKACKTAFPSGIIQGEDAGLHLLLTLDTYLSEREIVEGLEKKKILVHGIDEYYSNIDNREIPSPTLVLGFGSLPMSEIKQAIETLAQTIGDLEKSKS